MMAEGDSDFEEENNNNVGQPKGKSPVKEEAVPDPLVCACFTSQGDRGQHK